MKKKETVEEFIARGGKVTKSEDSTVSLEELLNKEVKMTEDGAKEIAEIISKSISDGLETKFKTKKD